MGSPGRWVAHLGLGGIGRRGRSDTEHPESGFTLCRVAGGKSGPCNGRGRGAVGSVWWNHRERAGQQRRTVVVRIWRERLVWRTQEGRLAARSLDARGAGSGIIPLPRVIFEQDFPDPVAPRRRAQRPALSQQNFFEAQHAGTRRRGPCLVPSGFHDGSSALPGRGFVE